MKGAYFLPFPRLRGEGAEPRSGETGEGLLFAPDMTAPSPARFARDLSARAGEVKGE
jgi:hypothetical protein